MEVNVLNIKGEDTGRKVTQTCKNCCADVDTDKKQ